MAKIKKLKENNITIYPATIPQAVVDPVDNTTLSEIVEDLALTFGDMNETKNILLAMSDLRSTVNEHSDSGLNGYAQYINLFIDKVNSFLEDADASDTTINRWKEIESFLAGITDTETLTGLLSDNLTSAKSYTDSKISSATANAVTMGSNAGAADRVMVSAGANKTAKDSGVALSSLARTTTATSSANGLMSSADKAKLDGIVPSSLAKTDMSNVSNETFYGKGTNAGFIPFEQLQATYGADSSITFISSVTEVRNALQGFGDGVMGVIIHMTNDEQGDSCMVLSSLKILNGFAIWFIGTDDYLHYAEVNTSGSSATVSSHRAYEISRFLTSIPGATSSILGGVRIGTGISIDSSSKISVAVATSSVIGGVKSGGNITVGSDGTVTVNQATKATQDSAGANITSTYLKASTVTDVTDYKEITL